MGQHHSYVYILTTANNRVMYIGVTNDLARRLSEHQNHAVPGFTARYHVHKLVYAECYPHITDAIAREKQLKRWRRDKKNALVETQNPTWRDLGVEILLG